MHPKPQRQNTLPIHSCVLDHTVSSQQSAAWALAPTAVASRCSSLCASSGQSSLVWRPVRSVERTSPTLVAELDLQQHDQAGKYAFLITSIDARILDVYVMRMRMLLLMLLLLWQLAFSWRKLRITTQNLGRLDYPRIASSCFCSRLLMNLIFEPIRNSW